VGTSLSTQDLFRKVIKVWWHRFSTCAAQLV
jgi:hypothetical protein